MDFVRPWLAIGGVGEAADAALRRQHGIGAVLSLLPVEFDGGEAHLTLSIADRVALPAAAIRTATAFIERQRRAGRTTLLHCQMGISRSPAVAACYLHEYAGLPLPEALHEVSRARPQADPHPALLDSIAKHYGAACEAAPAASNSGARSGGASANLHVIPAASQSSSAPIDLSANENPLGPSPRALAALAAALPTTHRYPDRQAATLRRELARQLGGSAGQILLGNGSCEILDLAARAFLAPGEAAIIAPPCFPAYRSAVRRAHGRLVEVPLLASEHFAYRLDRITAAIDATTRLIFLANPNNPTGSGVAREQLADWLDSLPPQVVVLLDEAYRDYHDDDASGAGATSAHPADTTGDALANGPALVRAGHRLLVVRSFSKLHGLAGLRLGYAFGPTELIAQLETLRPTYNTNAPAQAAALAALGDPAHQAASRALASRGLTELCRGLSALGLDCLPARGNFVLASCAKCRVDASQLAAGLAAAGILIKPGAAFGLPEHLRISVGLPDQNLRLLQEVGRLLAAAPKDETTRETSHEATHASPHKTTQQDAQGVKQW